MSVKDVDKGYKDLLARLHAIKKVEVTIGVHEAAGASTYTTSGVSVLQVANWNEFGTENIPARPFIGGWFDAHKKDNDGIVIKAGEKVAKGQLSAEKFGDYIGVQLKAEAQANIAMGVPPPNAPSTIARKGSSTPLIDTGLLRSSIDYKVGTKA